MLEFKPEKMNVHLPFFRCVRERLEEDRFRERERDMDKIIRKTITNLFILSL